MAIATGAKPRWSPTLYVSSQSLCELQSVVTAPRRVAAACYSTEAEQFISALLALPGLQVLPIPAGAVARRMDLLQCHPVTGGDIFDLQIVVAMQTNGISRNYTLNADDFEAFP